MSTKKVTIQLNEADIVMLRRVAKEVKRKEQDMYQLLFAHGIKYMFCDESVSIKKLPDGKQVTDLDYSKIFVSKKKNDVDPLRDG